ncbi:bifunctional folylpolyglutamate synthase/dihydrofolate synthase [Saccharomonospora piscinae]|uniref:bifunctional tetrahydrofolate synthase/dihydrofolate synthase n=1 Tax=Saccharomonospora piscinae TaxID=687388 RepID=UPI001106F62B|nr:folylpolyglutamate synthase/dihydrofolate synthase family protein [Saccharomonospora piscinae]TLW91183.1 bifunctional folylpolyglutamate synthase/dihydrofolate synthase [Saccharomonospora piscinae]
MPSDDQEFPPELSEGDNFIAGPLPDDESEAEPVDEAAIDARARRELLAVEAELDRRWPETRIEPSLTRITTLTNLLGDPQRAYPVIHVAGTNGKSSTARMIEALLTGLGLRVGRYTSPHLQLVTERISIDGAPIPAETYVNTFADVAPFVSMVDSGSGEDEPKLSKFEVLTAMAFAAFADAPVEVAVLETGLGGRWDATNVADAQISVITPVGFDHTDYLGDDLRSIAGEKAGIIKSGGVAVLAEQQPDAERVLLERTVEVDAMVARAGSEFGVLGRDIAVGGQLLKLQGLGGVYDEIFLPLHGAHQAANAALALAAVEAFFGAGKDRKLVEDVVREAFATVATPGRLEHVKAAPTVLLDAAHNPHGAAALASTVDEEFAFRRLAAVVGIMADKDAEGILTALEPVVSDVVVTSNSSPRAMPVDELAALAVRVFGEERVTVEPRLDAAVENAIALVEQTDDPEEPISGGGVLVTGSVVTAGEARTLFGKEPA